MNKRSGKTNGLAQRLLALLLCCVCLVAIMPVYAIASDAEAAAAADTVDKPNETEKQPVDIDNNTPAETISEDDEKNESTTSENTEVSENKGETTEKTEEESEKTDAEKLYDRIMACETADAYNELIASLTEEELALMDEFTEEQNKALTEKMAELGVYEAAAAVAYEGKLTITDNITTDGCLKVSGTDLDGKTVTYKWYKSTDGTNYTEVVRTKITGDLNWDPLNDKVGTKLVTVAVPANTSISYKITETPSAVDGYVRNAVEDEKLTLEGTIYEGGSATAEFTNSYSLANKNLTIAKTVSGNMADTTKTFKFTVKADKEMTRGEKTGTSFEFDLANNQSTTISVPVDAAVTVTEDSAGYKYSVNEEKTTVTGYTVVDTEVENIHGITFTMPDADSTVTFNNNKDVSIDTGVALDSLPYILILAVVVAGAVIVLRKRRSRDED